MFFSLTWDSLEALPACPATPSLASAHHLPPPPQDTENIRNVLKFKQCDMTEHLQHMAPLTVPRRND